MKYLEKSFQWSESEDTLLAEMTFKKMEEGGTQLEAFREAGEALGRTASACGFRFNAYIRKTQTARLAEAKSKRIENAKKPAPTPRKARERTADWAKLSRMMKSAEAREAKLAARAEELEKENKTLRAELERYRSKEASLESAEHETIQKIINKLEEAEKQKRA